MRLWKAALSFLVATALSVFAFSALGQGAYPSKPVRLMHGFGAGGNADIISRVMAQGISEGLGQPVVVEARTGAGGIVVTEYVARMPADGYTLILLVGGNAVLAAMNRSLPYDTVKDFAMVSLVSEFQFVIVTATESPFRTVGDMIAAAKKDPGKLTFSTPGIGTTQHLSGELFKSMAKVDMTHVPYRGGTTPISDVVAGRVDFAFDTFTPTLPQIRGGRLRAIAVTSTVRDPELPEVPTVGETIKNYSVTSWVGIAAPAGTPRPIVERLNKEVHRALAQPEVMKQLANLRGVPKPTTPEAMQKHIADEIVKYNQVVDAAKIERK